MSVPSLVLAAALMAADETPKPEDVKAGWTGFAVFLFLVAAVAVLCWSLVRQLRKADNARKAGVFGDQPEPPTAESPESQQPGESVENGSRAD